jgi:hypothetical protein
MKTKILVFLVFLSSTTLASAIYEQGKTCSYIVPAIILSAGACAISALGIFYSNNANDQILSARGNSTNFSTPSHALQAATSFNTLTTSMFASQTVLTIVAIIVMGARPPLFTSLEKYLSVIAALYSTGWLGSGISASIARAYYPGMDTYNINTLLAHSWSQIIPASLASWLLYKSRQLPKLEQTEAN